MEPIPKRHKFGGRQQRAAQSLGVKPDQCPDQCDLVDSNIKAWAWGDLSATFVQKQAANAYYDQARLLKSIGFSEDCISVTLKRVASIGSWGKHPGNCHESLRAFLGEPNVPSPFLHDVPMLLKKSKGGVANVTDVVKFPVLLPHVLFAHYFHTDRARFQSLFLGDQTPESMEAFWSELERRDDPRLRGHSMKNMTQWRRRCIPLALHGDAVPVVRIGKSGTRSVDVCSVRSIFASGSTLLIKLLLWFIFVDNVTDDTYQEIWRATLHSLFWLSKGVWPMVDMYGKPYAKRSEDYMRRGTPLADGYFSPIFSLTADLDHYAKAWHLRHYNANEMCELCPANRDFGNRRLCYNNFSDDAEWPSLVYGRDEWRALHDEAFLHYIFKLPDVDNLCLDPDELHILFLGVLGYFLGSVLYLLVFVILPGSHTDNMNVIWEFIAKFYHEHATPTQYTNLTISMFCGDDPHAHFPFLKGKGAEVRDVLPALVAFWDQQSPEGDVAYEWVGVCLEMQLKMKVLMHDHRKGVLLPMLVARQYNQHVQEFLLHYQKLAARYDATPLLLFSVPTKFHMLWHIGNKCHLINPRVANCMCDEDFVGRIASLIQACSAGTPMHLTCKKGMERYRWGYHFLAGNNVAMRARAMSSASNGVDD